MENISVHLRAVKPLLFFISIRCSNGYVYTNPAATLEDCEAFARTLANECSFAIPSMPKIQLKSSLTWSMTRTHLEEMDLLQTRIRQYFELVLKSHSAIITKASCFVDFFPQVHVVQSLEEFKDHSSIHDMLLFELQQSKEEEKRSQERLNEMTQSCEEHKRVMSFKSHQLELELKRIHEVHFMRLEELEQRHRLISLEEKEGLKQQTQLTEDHEKEGYQGNVERYERSDKLNGALLEYYLPIVLDYVEELREANEGLWDWMTQERHPQTCLWCETQRQKGTTPFLRRCVSSNSSSSHVGYHSALESRSRNSWASSRKVEPVLFHYPTLPDMATATACNRPWPLPLRTSSSISSSFPLSEEKDDQDKTDEKNDNEDKEERIEFLRGSIESMLCSLFMLHFSWFRSSTNSTQLFQALVFFSLFLALVGVALAATTVAIPTPSM